MSSPFKLSLEFSFFFLGKAQVRSPEEWKLAFIHKVYNGLMPMLVLRVCLHSTLCNLEEQMLGLCGGDACQNKANLTLVIEANMLNVLSHIDAQKVMA